MNVIYTLVNEGKVCSNVYGFCLLKFCIIIHMTYISNYYNIESFNKEISFYNLGNNKYILTYFRVNEMQLNIGLDLGKI